MTSRIQKVGVIGCGSRGNQLVRCFLASGRADIVAVADSNARSRESAKKIVPAGCLIHDDAAKVLDDPSIEVVYVGTPDDSHADLVIAGLDAGKAVICDKPMAITLGNCDRMVAAAQKTKGFLGVSMQNRYSFWCTTMKQLLLNGELGNAKMMWCREFRRPFSRNKVGNWILYHERSGGPFVEKNSHHWDIFNWWAQSRAVEVHAVTQNTGVHAPGDIWDCGWATVEYANGVIANLGLSMISPHGHDLDMGIVGTKGWAESIRTKDGGTVHLHENAEPHSRTYHANLPEEMAEMGHSGAEFPMIADLFDCIEQHTEPKTNCWWGRESIIIGLAAERSAREKRIIPVDEIRAESRFPVDSGPLNPC